ncbi:protein-L-isoaspartate O-methyltransferase [Malikia sp.]|uniref:protein-L-isoaspartate O-methyltransferase family protein n=1 Tax=Malikia sp. TaxID=2070706 RepID=UPI002610930F|nr:protein-L-isoaspartate O-methyltransferase [Malikia sp.]MDD2729341.1 protein-L-isoaspartate O-methyltransferase [Malikia sp.]
MSTEIAFDFDKARFNMIEQQIRPWNVLDAKVLALLGEVKREDFVPEAYQEVALADLEVPLGQGQCMLAPKVEARALQDLALQPGDNALEIGTGSGYMAALMAKQCARVVSIEINPALAQRARANLEAAGVNNVEVRTADAAADNFAACSAGAPFDAILLSGSVAELPEDLLTLLKPGGRLFAIVGQEPAMRATLVRAVADGQHSEQNWDIRAPRLQNFPAASQFKF